MTPALLGLGFSAALGGAGAAILADNTGIDLVDDIDPVWGVMAATLGTIGVGFNGVIAVQAARHKPKTHRIFTYDDVKAMKQ